MFGLIKDLLLNRSLNDPQWLQNQIGKPFKRPGKRGIKRLEKTAIALEESTGKQIHLIPTNDIDGTNRVLLVDKRWRTLWNMHCNKINKRKISVTRLLEMSIFSTSGKRKCI